MNLPIYPDYIFKHAFVKEEGKVLSKYYFGCFIRKQRTSDNKWFLIPVIKNYSNDPMHEVKDFINTISDISKDFHDDCYRMLLFYIVPEENEKMLSVLEPWRVITGELDSSQVSEEERLQVGKYRVRDIGQQEESTKEEKGG